MKKFIVVFAAALCAVGLQAAESFTHIQVRANPPIEIENADIDDGAKLMPSVADKTGKHILRTGFKAGDEVSTLKFAFKAGCDGVVSVRFFTASQSKGSTGVANIKVNGELISNSDYAKINEKSGLPAGIIASKNEELHPILIPAADGKPAMLRCGSKRYFDVKVPVKTGEITTISADMVGMDALPEDASAQ